MQRFELLEPRLGGDLLQGDPLAAQVVHDRVAVLKELVRLPYVPAPLEKAALVVGAAVGRAVGYTAEYAPAGEAAPAL
jgi:hypothetical protein